MHSPCYIRSMTYAVPHSVNNLGSPVPQWRMTEGQPNNYIALLTRLHPQLFNVVITTTVNMSPKHANTPTPATANTGHITKPAPLENSYTSDPSLRRILECTPSPLFLFMSSYSGKAN